MSQIIQIIQIIQIRITSALKDLDDEVDLSIVGMDDPSDVRQYCTFTSDVEHARPMYHFACKAAHRLFNRSSEITRDLFLLILLLTSVFR